MRAVLGDRKLSGTPGAGSYYGDVRSYSHPYPFGMPEPGRSWENGAEYRYGFNGMETDPEVKEGEGKHYTTYFRQYDPRLGRWWSTDPVVQPGQSPYVGLGNNPIGLVDPLGAKDTSPLDPGSGTHYTNPSQRGGGVPGPSPGGGGFGNLFGEVGREIDRQLRRIGDAAMRSNALRQAGRAGGRVGGGGNRSSTRGVYAGGGNTSARTLPQVPAVVTPGTGSGTTIGPETFAPNTAGQIESAVKSEPGDVETTIGIALGPLGWGHLFVRHVAAPAAYDLVDDVYIVATDIVYEQGWSVRGSRHMNGMGADGREQLDARLNVFTFGMGFVFTPELGAARMLSPETGTSLADETIEGTVTLFDDAVRSAADINVVTHTPQSVPTGAQLLEETAKGGWRVGEPITNLTAKGNVPKWSTVRQRFWKNEAFYNGSNYSEANLLRMKKGLAPQRINPNTGVMESMELHHHIVPQRDGGLFEFIKVWPDEHRALDPFRK